MDQPVGAEAENKLIAILKILAESSEPLGSITLARLLEDEGVFLSERAVRYHLKIADERGFTTPGGRDGRMITPEGRREVKDALVPQQLGVVRDRLELLAYLTTFDPARRTGQVAINTSYFAKKDFKKALAAMRPVFEAGLSVSGLVAAAEAGQKLGPAAVAAAAAGGGGGWRGAHHRGVLDPGGADGVRVGGGGGGAEAQARPAAAEVADAVADVVADHRPGPCADRSPAEHARARDARAVAQTPAAPVHTQRVNARVPGPWRGRHELVSAVPAIGFHLQSACSCCW